MNLSNLKAAEPKTIKKETKKIVEVVKGVKVNPNLWGLPTLYQYCDDCKTETVQYRNGEFIECHCGYKYNPKKNITPTDKDLKKPAIFTFKKT